MNCKQCGEEIGAHRPNQQFCSQEHKDAYHNRAKLIGAKMAEGLHPAVITAIQHRAKASGISCSNVIEYMASEFLKEYLPPGWEPRKEQL